MRVIERKGLQYLQHSFRKGDKVLTREKYLGKTVPKDIEKIKEEFMRACRKEAFFETFEKIKARFQKEWKGYPPTIKKKMLQQFAIDFTYNTNAIEGSTITRNETREIIDHHIAPNKPLSDVRETERHARLFQEVLHDPVPTTVKTLLDWHKMLFEESKPDIAGKIRDYLVRVNDYVAPDWQDLKGLLKEMVRFWKAGHELHPIEHAARLHYRFEKIHPFGDGNGRIGRLLMNVILWHAQYPLLIIEYKKRKSYYQALRKDEEHFVQYFIRRYLSIHKKYWK